MEHTEKRHRRKVRIKHHRPASQKKFVKRVKTFWHKYWGIIVAIIAGLIAGNYILPKMFQ